jgi:hypothetical protein
MGEAHVDDGGGATRREIVADEVTLLLRAVVARRTQLMDRSMANVLTSATHLPLRHRLDHVVLG